MKKTMALLVCAAALLFPSVALAETTEPIDQPGETLGLTFTLPEEDMPYAARLTDAFITSRVSFRAKDTIRIEPEAPAQMLVLNWFASPASYTVTQLDASGGTISEETITDRQLGRQVLLAENCSAVSILFSESGSLGGVVAYPSGAALPQSIAPAPTACDLLIITAEPGMEFDQFGAVLPVYAREKGISTAVLYLSDYGKPARAYEALSGLVEAGYTQYPLFGGFLSDNYDSYKITAGEFKSRTLTEYLKTQIQSLNPKVIVTHGISDPSGAHSLVSECVQIAVSECPSVQKLYCFGVAEGETPTVPDMNEPLNAYAGKTAAEVAQRAYEQHVSRRIFGLTIDASSAYTLAYTTVGADEAKNDLFEHIDTASLIQYSPATPSPAPSPEASATLVPAEQTQPEPPTPQPAQEDLPAAEQGDAKAPVLLLIGAGAGLSALLFAVGYRRIKAGRGKGDAVCFCLIPLALGIAAAAILAGATAEAHRQAPAQTAEMAQQTPQPSATPAPSDTPAQTETPVPTEEPAADPDAQFYRAADEPAEVIVVDVANGRWEYRSDDLGITIDRVSAKNSQGKPLTYFVADIHMRDISQFRPAFGAEGHTGRGAIHPWLIARREKAVLWLTGDNLINDEREEKGILIRDGRLFWSAEKEDTLAIYPDMTMRIIKKLSMKPLTLLEDGVENAYSFGPTLIENGVINDQAYKHRVRRANPRAGIGYYSPGHYIAIVVDGRQKDYSIGMPVEEFAQLFATYGCTIAYNLDGGLSAAMIFMGEQLNTHSGQRTGGSDNISYQRAVPDGLMFGYSAQVPSVDDPIVNDGNSGNQK